MILMLEVGFGGEVVGLNSSFGVGLINDNFGVDSLCSGLGLDESKRKSMEPPKNDSVGKTAFFEVVDIVVVVVAVVVVVVKVVVVIVVVEVVVALVVVVIDGIAGIRW
eukprot:TRINITY_DN6422_c1_g1_i6.p2 TRINITY_DN6422_c1_g1~~TRINITY_DN6422_c1_g1_i6.p2  ORF type:complete len:108 (+),score=1.81 TRINITY_DN6422_c1_g1_i6:96-419(+)